MKVTRSRVIQDNITLLSKLIGEIRTGDALTLIADRVGDRVKVMPDDVETEEVTIVFDMNCLMAVSKGASLDDVVNLLSVGANGAVGAVGTGLAGAMQAANGGIAGATAQTLGEIMHTEQSQNNVSLIVPVTDIDVDAGAVNVRVDATMEGWTRTTDWDVDEIANLTYHAQLLNQPGGRIKTENVGTSRQIPVNSSVSSITRPVSASETLAQVDIAWNLSTDGAFTHDTISLIQIATATVVVKYAAEE